MLRSDQHFFFLVASHPVCDASSGTSPDATGQSIKNC